VDSAVLQTGFDSLTAANQQLTDDAIGNKATYDRQQVGACDLNSRLSGQSIHHALRYYHCMQVDSASLQAGFDSLTAANQQLTDDAAGNKACFDIQKASYDRLQVGEPEVTLHQHPSVIVPCRLMQVDSASLQAGFDSLTTANRQLTDDAAGNKACFDIQKASYDRLQVREPDVEQIQAVYDFIPRAHVQVDSGLLQTGFDSLTTANQQLTDDANDNKAMYDRQQVGVPHLTPG
jgi:hypothetical protein